MGNGTSLLSFVNVSFVDKKVKIDGCRFENCQFLNCQLVYAGGSAEAFNCRFDAGNVWVFEDQASFLLDVLESFGWQLTQAVARPHNLVRFPSIARENS